MGKSCSVFCCFFANDYWNAVYAGGNAVKIGNGTICTLLFPYSFMCGCVSIKSAKDITDTILEQMRDIFIILDYESRYVASNAAAKKLFPIFSDMCVG